MFMPSKPNFQQKRGIQPPDFLRWHTSGISVYLKLFISHVPTCCVLLKPLAIRCWQWRNSGCAYEWIYLKDSKSEYINTYIYTHYYAFDGSSAFFWQGTVLVQSFSRVSTLVIAHYLGSLASLIFFETSPGLQVESWLPLGDLDAWMMWHKWSSGHSAIVYPLVI